MGIQKKHGKGRLDKWYKLAKEKGYRARAAFKLIQLNKRYHFLETSKVLIDLCAAPGSWCQVAAEVMPPGSLIVGVDLAPIKAIPRVISFQSDITTENCRSQLRGYLKGWKCDTVLHDGAPNVGTAWVQDAFTQAELVLQSMKLATEFLKEGGTFVTKVFRSRDFNNLLWVFNQLFTKVETTKPPSSRNVSAEIFVVCRGYKAPKKLDPKFLDPKSVFEELPTGPINAEAKVFKPKVQKRKRDGYEEGEYTQFKEEPVSKFVESGDPVQMLATLNRFTFPKTGDIVSATLAKLPETTQEVLACCNDLKVLGKKDFRLLLRWRLSARKKIGLSAKDDEEEKDDDEVVQVEDMDEETKLAMELEELKKREQGKKKKEKKKSNETKRKEIVRMQLHMVTPTEIGLEQQGLDSVFHFNDAEAALKQPLEREAPELEEDSEESSEDESEYESDSEADNLERTLDSMYENYVEVRNAARAKPGHKRARNFEDETWEGFGSDAGSEAEEDEANREREPAMEVDSDYSDEEMEVEDGEEEGETKENLSKNASLFFEQSVFSGIDIEDSEEEKEAAPVKERKAKGVVAVRESKPDAEDDAMEEVEYEDKNVDDGRDSNIEIITKEAMALAHKIAEGKHSKYSIVDDSFNRWTMRDRDGLPDWFLDDENRHSRPVRPVTAAAAAAIKEKMRAMNARPIKKVREAKARKKFKAVQKMEKLKKKSSMLAEEEGTTEREKASAITKLLSKAAKNKPKKKVTVVVARGANKGKGRPKGVKGRYKIVDARMKKDTRALKRIAKKKK